MGRRKGGDVPHTAPKMSKEKQCGKAAVAGSTLCASCQSNMEHYTTGNKAGNKHRDWHGYINGDMPDHSQFFGGKWFSLKFKKGFSDETLAALGFNAAVASTVTATATVAPVEPIADTNSVVSEETQVSEVVESVADETAQVTEEEWRPYAHNGINYVWISSMAQSTPPLPRMRIWSK
jgi:hypothetical protein